MVVVWDGKGGDAPGGTGDMVQQVRQLGGIVEHIDTTKFDYWKTKRQVLDSIFHKLLSEADNNGSDKAQAETEESSGAQQ